MINPFTSRFLGTGIQSFNHSPIQSFNLPTHRDTHSTMAAIDKTYISGSEYPQYRRWWIANYQKMIKELGEPIWLYTFHVFGESNITPQYLKHHTADLEYYKNKFDFPVWNTSETADLWLIKNCNIPSFRKRMMEVYPHTWKGFKGLKIPKGEKKQGYVNRG